MVYYQNNEIKIRDIIEKDVVSLFLWWIDRDVNKYDPRPFPRNSKELVDECVNYCNIFDTQKMNENVEERQYKYFIITNHEDQPIGFVNFFSIDEVKKQGEMGIIIGDKTYWKKGIAYKAVDIVVDYIFNTMDIDRIYIETSSTNIASLRLFEKLNFQRYDEYLEDGIKCIVMEKRRCRG